MGSGKAHTGNYRGSHDRLLPYCRKRWIASTLGHLQSPVQLPRSSLDAHKHTCEKLRRQSTKHMANPGWVCFDTVYERPGVQHTWKLVLKPLAVDGKRPVYLAIYSELDEALVSVW